MGLPSMIGEEYIIYHEGIEPVKSRGLKHIKGQYKNCIGFEPNVKLFAGDILEHSLSKVRYKIIKAEILLDKITNLPGEHIAFYEIN